MGYQTPILFLFYRKKEIALKTFSQIAKQKPKRLYLFSDYPARKEDKQAVFETRKAILDRVNWQCDLKTYFPKKNIGFKYFIYKSLKWVFKFENYAIYIEDDVYCSDDFFR